MAIQSMTKVKTSDADAVRRQAGELHSAGCEIIRVAVKDGADAAAISKIKPGIKLPLVADIHFDWRLAIKAIDNGADKIRLNPGNIYKKQQIREVAAAARQARVPIRVGVNSGSIRRDDPHVVRSASQAGAMVRSALNYIKILEGFKFRDIVISLKGSNIFDTIEAYRKISGQCDYPLHLGVTATGAPFSGLIKSSIALGILLSEGIGDTIRVSLTDMAVKEVAAAKGILQSLGLRSFGPQIISCPTCGRCEVDLMKIVADLEKGLSTLSCQPSTLPTKLAVMGCVVNGPGEAKDADAGVAFGAKEGLLFRKGSAVKKVPFEECVDTLLKEVKRLYV